MNKIAILLVSIVIVVIVSLGVFLSIYSDNYLNKDTTPPSITLLTPKNNSIISGGTIIDFDVSDDHLRFVEYSINNVTIDILELPFDIDTTDWLEGVKEIKLIAIDEASNKAVKTHYFTIDSTSPKITLINHLNNTHISPGSIIGLNISDAHSFSVDYSINGGVYNNLESGYYINTTNWGLGTYLINVSALDIAGNLQKCSFYFEVSTPPSTILTIGYPQFLRPLNNDSIIYVNANTEFNLTTIDSNGFGVKSTWFRIWNPNHPFIGEGPGSHLQTWVPAQWSEWIEYTGNFTLSDDIFQDWMGDFYTYDDLHIIEYYSVNNIGLNETVHNISIILDKFSPDSYITPIVIEDPIVSLVNSNTIFNLTVSDWTIGSSSPGIGINSTWFRIWGVYQNVYSWTPWVQYTGNFTLSGDAGRYTIEFYSIDYFAHTEEVHSEEYLFVS